MADDYISKIEDDLNAVEARVIAEFKNNNEKLTGSEVGGLSDEFRLEIHYTVEALREALAYSGSEKHLELTSERHEEIRERLYVVNQLLDRQIALSSFNEAHLALENLSRKQGYNPVSSVSRGKPRTVMTQRQSQGLMDSIRDMFGSKGAASSGIRITQTGPQGRKEIYQSTGVFSASHELAMLAAVVNVKPLEEFDKPENPATHASGKAQFASRDIVSEMDHLPDQQQKPAKRDIAQSPEAIRAKLEARKDQLADLGKAKFESHDLSSDIQRESAGTTRGGRSGEKYAGAKDFGSEQLKKRAREHGQRLSLDDLKPKSK